jgi:hypothetical protein
VSAGMYRRKAKELCLPSTLKTIVVNKEILNLCETALREVKEEKNI